MVYLHKPKNCYSEVIEPFLQEKLYSNKAFMVIKPFFACFWLSLAYITLSSSLNRFQVVVSSSRM